MTAKHLSDCFVGVMAYVSHLLQSVQGGQPPYDEVKSDIHRLLAESEAQLDRGMISRDDFDQARFAVCAWVDEAILNSRWLQKNRWLNDQLQRSHYHTAEAGEQFFERLNGLGPRQREVREVYYLCLALGFAGRYCHPEDAFPLEQIRVASLKLLVGDAAALASLDRGELFPEAYPKSDLEPGQPQGRPGSRFGKAIWLAAPVLLFCLLYLVYHFALSGISENFLRTVAN